jgi:hypothetical protein
MPSRPNARLKGNFRPDPLKVFVPFESGQTVEGGKPGSQDERPFFDRADEDTVPSYRMQGYQEGKWLREWEPAIRRCVMTKYSGRISQPDHINSDPSMADPRELLDGYTSDL